MPSLVYKTPLLVPIPSSFEAYLKRATKKCRYEYRNLPELPHREVEFDLEQVRYFMELWTKQPIRGGFPVWRRYTPEKCQSLYEQGLLRVFFAEKALQMVEISGRYVYAHPPLYDKATPVAKAMWFGLIQWCCGRVDWLDLGGGSQKTWDQLERTGYKWLYVPKDIERKPWKVQVCSCGWRQLVERPQPCGLCSSRR